MSSSAAVQFASPHSALIAELASSECEATIERAVHQLSRGGDLPLLFAVASALGSCRLSSLAVALLRSAGSAAEHPRVRELEKQLQHAPDGTVDSATSHARYRTSLDSLARTHRELHARLSALPPPEHLKFVHSSKGNVHALRTHVDQRLSTVFPLADHVAQTESIASKLPPTTLLSAICLLGMPSMATLDHLWKQSVDGYRPPVDIVETDLEALQAWLCMLERPERLSDGRLTIHFGPHATQAYADALVDRPERLLPSIVLSNHRVGWVPPRLGDAWCRDVDMRRAARRAEQLSVVLDRLRGRDVAFWRRRFLDAQQGRASLRIVGFTNRYSTVVQFAMRDLASAFARLGHEFTVATQSDDSSAAIDVSAVLAERDCDLIVAINHLRFEYRDAMPANLPYIGWIQDHVDQLWTAGAGGSIGEFDRVVAHAPDVLSGLYGYPRENMLASSNLTDPHTYSPEPLSEVELDLHRCDVSFVSHGSATPMQLCADLERATSAAFGRFMRETMCILHNRVAEEGCLNAQQLVEVMLEAESLSGHAKLTPSIRRANVYPHVARLHDRILRHQTLQWAASWARSRGRSMRLYGRGWESHPDFKDYAAGEIASGLPLRAVYQASRISLQANAYSSLHQRLLDGFACGALVLSRFNPADFVREPFTAIARAIRRLSIHSMRDLVQWKLKDVELGRACDEAERLSGAVIAGEDDPRRRAQIEVLAHANDIADLRSSEGLFAMLRDMKYLPGRTAGDLPGFAQTAFASEECLHALLDRLVDDEASRMAIVSPMRASILEHDTFDALASRMISTFAGASD